MITIDIAVLNDVTLVEIHGRIDGLTAAEFSTALAEQLDRGRARLLIDLWGVEYMSSVGLREIVSALKAAQQVNGDLRIARPSDRVREVFELAGLDQIVMIYGSLDEAVSSY